MWLLSFSGGITAPVLLQALLQLDEGNWTSVTDFFLENKEKIPFFTGAFPRKFENHSGSILITLSRRWKNLPVIAPDKIDLPEKNCCRLFTEIFQVAGEKVLAPFTLFVYLSILIILDKYCTRETLLFFFPEVDTESDSRTFHLLKGRRFRLCRGVEPLSPLLAALLVRFSMLCTEQKDLFFHDMLEIPDPLGKENRVRVFKTAQSGVEKLQDTVILLETNIDDTTPEIIASAMERLLQVGALDYVVIPAGMKKNRTGFQIQVLSPPEKKDQVIKSLFEWTSTFGVRQTEVKRIILDRSIEEVETPFGKIRVKKGIFQGKTIRISPEFDDIVNISRKTGNSTQDIYNTIYKEYIKIE